MDETAAVRLLRPVVLATPFLLAVPVGYAVLFRAWDTPLTWAPVGTGALGWSVAFALRAPVGLLAKRMPERTQTIVVASSGPLEELVRLASIAVAGRTFARALSLGLGWAAIEVVYAIASSIVALTIARGTGGKAAKIREAIAEHGMAAPVSPFVGVLERASASALHIGAALLIARHSLFALALVPAHSAVNLLVLRYARRSMWLAQSVVAVAGGTAFAGGVALFGRL